MSFLDLDLESVPDRTLAADGEHEISCNGVELKEAKSIAEGKTVPGKYISLQLRVMNDPAVPPFYHTLSLPSVDDDADAKTFKLQNLKAACQALGVSLTPPIDINAFVGKTTWARLKTVKDKNNQYPDKNDIAGWTRRA